MLGCQRLIQQASNPQIIDIDIWRWKDPKSGGRVENYTNIKCNGNESIQIS